jgi:Flp pilus assembly protein TadG
MRLLSRWVQSRHAASAVEFAIIVPLMLLLMAGTVEFGRAFQAYQASNQLATRYASTWADCSDYPAGTCNTILSTYTSTYAIQNLVPQLTAANLTIRMIQFQMSSGTANVIYASPSGATLTAAELAVATKAVASGQTGVVVTVTYVYNLVFFQKLLNSIFPTGTRTFTFIVSQDKS